ncbi:MAG: glycoside hydrolase family 3 N-terminal domain-containing protein [Fimbriimonadaceae bacterium]
MYQLRIVLVRWTLAVGLAGFALVAAANKPPVPLYLQPNVPIELRVKDLVARMTLEEKARQLDMYQGASLVDKKVDDTHAAPNAHLNVAAMEKALGELGAGSIHDVYPSGALSNEIQRWVMSHNRLGIPVLFIEEGVHGYSGLGQTIFPTSIALGSTWDVALAQQTGAAIAAEARSHGVDMLLCPVLDVARDPRWGRIEEDFGEDAYLTGLLGAAYVRGAQGDSLATDHTVVAEPKHFAGHGSPEGGLNTSPVHAGEREVRSVFLRSFEPAIRDAHAMGVMAAYHEIDGVPCAGNPWLLTTVLRDEWRFKGFVLSDLGAIEELYGRHHVAETPAAAVRMAISAGVDMQFYDFDHATFQGALVDGVRLRLLPERILDQAVSRVLRVKFELGLFDKPLVDSSLAQQVTRAPAHLALALTSAREAMCLLKNEHDLLPLPKSIKQIAVIGPNATVLRMGDYTVTPTIAPPSLVHAIEALVPGAKVSSNDGSDIEAAVTACAGADVIVCGLGERAGISGEGSDRSHLGLPGNQEALLERLSELGKPIVLVLTNGRPLTIGWAATHVPAIIEAWYPGERGSQAIAETIFGDNNPAGRLPISFPRSVGAIPDFYNHDPSKSTNYVDGQAAPLYPFGFGLSFTTFRYGGVTCSVHGRSAATEVDVSTDVTNTGPRDGDEVVQLYLRKNTSSVETPVKSLKGFQRIHLSAGSSQKVTFHLNRRELEIWGAAKRWSVEPGEYTVTVGGSSAGGVVAHFEVRN